MFKRTIISIVIAIVVVIGFIGCGNNDDESTRQKNANSQTKKVSETPLASPSETPDPVIKERERIAANLKKLEETTSPANTDQLAEQKKILGKRNESPLADQVCEAKNNVDIAENIRSVSKGSYKERLIDIITVEKADKILKDQLAKYAEITFRAIKEPQIYFRCIASDGSAGDAPQLLFDLAYIYDRNELDVKTSGMTIQQMRETALNIMLKENSEIFLALKSSKVIQKKNSNSATEATPTISFDSAKRGWEVMQNPWAFTTQEFGIPDDIAKQLNE